ncbi:MAG: hypothetical protein BYD32DRAFT_427691 [Podila humilis]|nr:MAG: hypothetical protein BYD32DRAFT_427691 [Podila humilis]
MGDACSDMCLDPDEFPPQIPGTETDHQNEHLKLAEQTDIVDPTLPPICPSSFAPMGDAPQHVGTKAGGGRRAS